MFDGVWDFFTALMLVNVLLWMLATFLLDKMWPVDFIWSSYPIIQVLYLFFEHHDKQFAWHRCIVVLLTTIWGLRLTGNFVLRGGIGHEDWRYSDQRIQLGANFKWLSLFSVFIGQSVFMFTGCLSYFPAMRKVNPSPLFTLFGTFITCSAIVLESVSDRQMDNFIAKSSSKTARREVMRSGVWAWSRHPNYLGEW